MIRFIGDIHGKWNGYKNLIANCDYTIQVGDFGLGFYDFPDDILKMYGNHKFIRGNHDNPELCKIHPWYLGDYGHIPKIGNYINGIYYIGGAWTPDFFPRKPGVNWWFGEELEYKQLEKAIYECAELQPKIIVTHDCPREIKENHLGKYRYADNNGYRYNHTRTDNALQVLFEIYQPYFWIFGHYHERLDYRLNGTRFICLEELGVFDIE